MGTACSGARTVKVNIQEGNGSTQNNTGNWMVGSEVIDVQPSASANKTGPRTGPGVTPHKGLAAKGVDALLGVLQRNANVFVVENIHSKHGNHQGKNSELSSTDVQKKRDNDERSGCNTKVPETQRYTNNTSGNVESSPEGRIIITGRNGTYRKKNNAHVKTTVSGEFSKRKPKKVKETNKTNEQNSGRGGVITPKHSNNNDKEETIIGRESLESKNIDETHVVKTGGGGGGKTKEELQTSVEDRTKIDLSEVEKDTPYTTAEPLISTPEASHLHLPKSDNEAKAKVEEHYTDRFLFNLKSKAKKAAAYEYQIGPGCTCSSCTTPPKEVGGIKSKLKSDNELTLYDEGRLMIEPVTGVRRSKSDLFHQPTYDYSWMKLSGEVDDCNCKVESVSEYNNLRIYPRVKSLVSKDYFRFFKVNLNKPCPFWPDDGQCAIRACAVCPCTDDEVPCGLKDEEAKGDNKYTEKVNKDGQDESCETRSQEEIRLSALDTTISQENAAAFETWREHDDAQVNFCQVDDEQSNDMAYVDLLLNPERYTGYKGPSPHRIWNSIYNENCFKPDPNTTGYQSLLTNKKNVNKGLCLEKRVFYRLISGLHSSINIHLCADYLLTDDPFGGETWGPNIEEFKRRFDPATSDGEGPIRLKNLYFTYLVVLRAIAKAAPILEKEAFYTGHNDSDKEIKKGIVELLSVIQSFNNHFNESLMFQGNSEQATQLKEEFRSHFWNISRIMDCVGCDKCKLWGKLQIQGLGTALKILFTDEKHTLRLSRQEIQPLLVGFSKLSNSIAQVDNFQGWIAEDSVDPGAIHKKPKGSPFV